MIVYRVTNNVNGKTYVGVTRGKLEYRWKDHVRGARVGDSRFLCASIRKHGEASFTVEQIDSASSVKELHEREVYWIALQERGRHYNMTPGGDGVEFTHEVRAKMSEFQKRRPRSADEIEKLKSNRKPIVFTDEVKAKMSAATLGKPKPRKAKSLKELVKQAELRKEQLRAQNRS